MNEIWPYSWGSRLDVLPCQIMSCVHVRKPWQLKIEKNSPYYPLPWQTCILENSTHTCVAPPPTHTQRMVPVYTHWDSRHATVFVHCYNTLAIASNELSFARMVWQFHSVWNVQATCCNYSQKHVFHSFHRCLEVRLFTSYIDWKNLDVGTVVRACKHIILFYTSDTLHFFKYISANINTVPLQVPMAGLFSRIIHIRFRRFVAITKITHAYPNLGRINQ